MNGENITKEALKNLVVDRDSPITQGLVQLEESRSDADNLSVLFDHNVTRGALKNLVTDKPSPITVALAQRSDADNLSVLFDHNVTRGALKNLVTDKPSPITVALGQRSDADNLSVLFDHNVTRGALKNLVTDKPSPITVALGQRSDADNLSVLFDHNVTRGALKNLVTDKPSPITVALGQRSDADNLSVLFDHNVTRGALKNLVTDKPSPITVALAQQPATNSTPNAQALLQLERSDADNLSVLFDHNVTRGALKNLVTDKPSPITVALAQKGHKKAHKKHHKKPGHKDFHQDDDDYRPATMTLKGMDGVEVIHGDAVVGGSKVKFAQNARITGTQDEETPFVADLTVDGTRIHFVEKKAPEPVKHVDPPKQEPANWVEANDKGDRDPEMIALRKKLKEGVISYAAYMEKKLH